MLTAMKQIFIPTLHYKLVRVVTLFVILKYIASRCIACQYHIFTIKMHYFCTRGAYCTDRAVFLAEILT